MARFYAEAWAKGTRIPRDEHPFIFPAARSVANCTAAAAMDVYRQPKNGRKAPSANYFSLLARVVGMGWHGRC